MKGWMIEMNVDELNIKNVSHQESDFFINTFSITFEIDGFRYGLIVSKGGDGLFHPKYIEHFGNCKYCGNNFVRCHELMNLMRNLFHRLIEHPSIRLEWLYINHV